MKKISLFSRKNSIFAYQIFCKNMIKKKSNILIYLLSLVLILAPGLHNMYASNTKSSSCCCTKKAKHDSKKCASTKSTNKCCDTKKCNCVVSLVKLTLAPINEVRSAIKAMHKLMDKPLFYTKTSSLSNGFYAIWTPPNI